MNTTRTARRQSNLASLALADFNEAYCDMLDASERYGNSADNHYDRQAYYAAREAAYAKAHATRSAMILACFGIAAR